MDNNHWFVQIIPLVRYRLVHFEWMDIAKKLGMYTRYCKFIVAIEETMI